MTQTILKNILKNLDTILTDSQRAFGFGLTEEADDFAHLYLGKIRIASFGQRTTVEEIHTEVGLMIRVIIAYQTTDRFEQDASEWARQQGWREAE